MLQVDKIYIPDEYRNTYCTDFQKNQEFGCDIAILKLSKPIPEWAEKTWRAMPIQLPQNNTPLPNMVNAAGYGFGKLQIYTFYTVYN